MSQDKNNRSAVRLPIYISIAISIGVLIGANMADGSGTGDTLYKSVYKFRQVLTHIQNNYVDDVDAESLSETAITEMLTKLDPHTVYIPAKDLQLTNSQLEGNFEGVGVEFNIFNDTIYVITAISGGPSEKLGIRSGDKIIKVGDKTVAGTGITNRGVIDLLRGKRGSKVVVAIKRNGEPELISYEITRDVIPQHSVDVSYMIDEQIGYIKVSRFAETTFMEFKEALYTLQKSGMKKLILDLTGNPGGYMDQAINIADEFLSGTQMIVYTKGKETKNNAQHYSREKGDFETGHLIVMVDEGSASASEIVSGALQDHDRALIVGRRSFGKGLVQMPITLNDGSAMRLTISRYYTPSGRCIQKPYNGSTEEYHDEYVHRFSNGEIFSKDSIKVNDTLIYKTDKGRVVYGGGGIMPDFFVPMDTSTNSRYLNRLFNSNSIASFSLKMAEENRKSFNKMGFEAYRDNYEISNEILEQLVAEGKLNNVKFDAAGFEKSKDALRIYLKAFIARNIWQNEGFYPIFNQNDEIFNKAVALIRDENSFSDLSK